MDDNTIYIRAYFDGDYSESDWDSMQCVETEVLADFHNTHKTNLDIIHYDVPKPLSNLPGLAVYQRKE